MALPTYDQLMRPVLVLAAEQSITRGIATETMVKQHQLTAELAHNLRLLDLDHEI